MAGKLWGSFIHPVTAFFRKKRFAKLLELAPDLLTAKILDVGGSVHFWEKAGVDLAAHDITLLNIAADGQSTDMAGNIVRSMIILYDGDTIPWPDAHFDWVICNSVIEHVQPEQRAKFCSEIQRVGKRFMVQTPAFEFPIEPHFVMPFLHWLPRKIGRKLAGYGLWAILSKPTKKATDEYFEEVNLLRRKDIAGYFPNAELVTERVGLLPKSYTAIYRRS